MQKLQKVFEKINYSLRNPASEKIHCWLPNENQIDASELHNFLEHLPFGVQWWRGNDDIYVSIENEFIVGGYTCRITLVGLTRQEQAELAKLLIENITPEKNQFPDDFFVFGLSAQ